MKRLCTALFAFSFAASLATLPVAAQNNSMSNSSSSNSMAKTSAATTASDTTFMKKAAQGGLAEVELGKLATEKASSSEVKQFGERMVTDHTKANDKLKQVAIEEHVTLPDKLDAKDQATKDSLEKLSGADFDRAYMKDMVKDHKADIAEFEHESKSGENTAVKDFATQTLPTLHSHLREAEKVAPTVEASNTAAVK